MRENKKVQETYGQTGDRLVVNVYWEQKKKTEILFSYSMQSDEKWDMQK